MRLRSAFLYDVKLQFRHGFYYAYMLISAAYIILLNLLPINIRETVDIILTFSDPSVLGFFFIGGLVLLEKGQNIYDNLFVTPYTAKEYLLSKTLSLTLLSVITSLIIHLSAFGFETNLLLFALGVTQSSTFFTMLGLGVAVRCQTLNGFFFLSTVSTFIFVVPIIEVIGLWSSPLFYFIPAKASLLLIGSAFEPLTTADVIYAVGVLLAWNGAAFVFAKTSFQRYIILKIGGGDRQ